MSVPVPNLSPEQQQSLLNLLRLAEKPLKMGLHRHGLPHSARVHLERAFAHLNEAFVAVNEPGRERTVEQLQNEISFVDRFREQLQHRPPPGVIIKSILP
jgi:hypothetical protein